MASPTPKRPTAHNATSRPGTRGDVRRGAGGDEPEVVDPRWLLKALSATLAAAAVLGYLSVCLLVYLGSWQQFITPSARVDKTPSVPFQPMRFDSAASGRPRLTGWWVPAASDPERATTVLYLHDATGSLSQTIFSLEQIHEAGVNVFAFDYRGFGKSDGPHPSETQMYEDCNAALEFLTQTRHLAPARIVPLGAGLGAVLAARLANAHTEIPALVLDNPDPDAFSRILKDRRSRLLPMRLLVRDRFDLRSAVASYGRPKLVLDDASGSLPAARVAASQGLFRELSEPKMMVTLRGGDDPAYVSSLRRFLDEYVPAVSHSISR